MEEEYAVNVLILFEVLIRSHYLFTLPLAEIDILPLFNLQKKAGVSFSTSLLFLG